jgi:hypothetical protein
MSDPRPLMAVRPTTPLLLFESDSKGAAEAVSGWREAGLTVRVVRGRKMRTVDRLFDEFAAALQFPDYFGENWPAFNECLADMDWLAMNNGVAIAVLQPGEVLADSPVELEVLVRAITDAAETYAEPISLGEWWDRPAVPFHVVLHAGPGESDDVVGRWSAAGATVHPFGR